MNYLKLRMLTKRENLLTILKGEKPFYVPFNLNFKQWWEHNRDRGKLPRELRKVSTYIEAMKALDCDIFTRNVSGGFTILDQANIVIRTSLPNDLGEQITAQVRTPYGNLHEIVQTQNALSCSHVEKYLVTDWKKERDSLLWLIENREYIWNDGLFCENDKQISSDGILMIALGTTPLKFLHNHFGLDGTCYFVNDFFKDAKQLCELYWNKILPVVQLIASHPDTKVIIFMDNVDTPFYPPAICADFWTPFIRQAAEILHNVGKYVFVHTCGQLAGLKDEFVKSNIDGLEGITAPPLGDWPYHQAKACHPRFIVNGGFSAHEQQMPDEQALRQHYEKIFKSMQPLHRWIFSASCQTAINTSWERIKYVRDLVRELGRIR